jgi:AhpD family alkylhydroperoxidase
MTTFARPAPVPLVKQFPAGYEALFALETAVREAVDPTLFHLVKLRASQINGCAYCIDMHSKEARADGDTEERLYMLNAWRESDLYTDQERAALALTEEVTLIADGHVPAEIEAEARSQFDETAYAALVFTIATINAWNRISITGHSEPGHYRPRPRATATSAN